MLHKPNAKKHRAWSATWVTRRVFELRWTGTGREERIFSPANSRFCSGGRASPLIIAWEAAIQVGGGLRKLGEFVESGILGRYPRRCPCRQPEMLENLRNGRWVFDGGDDG